MRNVVKYLEKSKEKFPKKIAVIEEDQKITYEELEDKSKRVGNEGVILDSNSFFIPCLDVDGLIWHCQAA